MNLPGEPARGTCRANSNLVTSPRFKSNSFPVHFTILKSISWKNEDKHLLEIIWFIFWCVSEQNSLFLIVPEKSVYFWICCHLDRNIHFPRRSIVHPTKSNGLPNGPPLMPYFGFKKFSFRLPCDVLVL